MVIKEEWLFSRL